MEKQPSLITKIKVNDATFHEETVDGLSYVNFFFGKNGAGKSTIAEAFYNPENIEWHEGEAPEEHQILVYNQDYIDRNLADYGDLKGVFTLSEENAEIRAKIDAKTAEQTQVIEEGRQAATDRDNKGNELKPLRDTFELTCWGKTEQLRKSFDQTQGGKKKKLQFTDEVLSGSHSPVEHKPEDIQKIYDVAYDPNARKYPEFKKSTDLLGTYDLSGEPLLAEPIQSRSETEFAKFMKALNATEWVKKGHAEYVGHSKGKCPFCQGKLPENFEKDIAQAFDESYQKSLDSLETFETEYKRKMQDLLVLLRGNLDDVYPKANTEVYEKLIAQLAERVATNERLIAEKRQKPVDPVTLENTDELLTKIDEAATAINTQVKSNNDIVATKHDKQIECFNMVWEEIAFVLKDEVEAYNTSKKEIETKKKELAQNVVDLQEKYKQIHAELLKLNASVINTAATVDSINAHLKDSGFEGFHLREKEGVKGTYEVIREDGKVATKLSEGERRFIAFLYFYHVVRGSQSEGDSTKDKIVVIDDPICSMDSSSLFIVSALVREMIGICANNITLGQHEYKGTYIRQLFVFTHNAFFHREITYNQVEHYRYVSFFKVNKKDNHSSVEKCIHHSEKISEQDSNYNPVQNSYEALWQEYKKLDAPIPLMNVIRRILEYYFLQLCGYEGEELNEKVLAAVKKRIEEEAAGGEADNTKYHLAQSMLSYINRADSFNEGFHFVDESIDVEQYKDVFRMIFGAMGQSQHFLRMMNEKE